MALLLLIISTSRMFAGGEVRSWMDDHTMPRSSSSIRGAGVVFSPLALVSRPRIDESSTGGIPEAVVRPRFGSKLSSVEVDATCRNPHGLGSELLSVLLLLRRLTSLSVGVRGPPFRSGLEVVIGEGGLLFTGSLVPACVAPLLP